MNASSIATHLSAVQTAFDELVAENVALRQRITELEALLVVPAPAPVPLLLPSQLVAKKPVGRPRKLTVPSPLPAGGEAPGPEAYRLAVTDIKEDVCIGRLIATTDKRWSVAILAEAQCGAPVTAEADLCAACAAKKKRYEEDYSYRKWHGTVLEEPPAWMHMLRTAWATQAIASGKLKWLGSDAGDSASVASSSASSTKSAAKEAVKAEKAAAKAAKAAAKETAKVAAKAAKEAAKAAAKEAKEAAKAAKAAVKKPTVGPVDGYPTKVGGKLYWQSGYNLYEYNMENEHGGKFVGVLLSDGLTIVQKV